MKRIVKFGLVSIVSAMLGITACNSRGNNPEYQFNGKIGEEQVRFYELDFGKRNILEVKNDGTKIRYVDWNDNLKISDDFIEIIVNKNKVIYKSTSSNPAVKAILQKAQEQFDSYLKKIFEINTAPLEKSDH